MRRWRDGRPRGGGGGRGAGQAAIARAGQGPEGLGAEERAVAEGTTTLAGGVDGGRVHHSADGPEMEVATLAPLGPERQAAPPRAGAPTWPGGTPAMARGPRTSGGGCASR